MTNSAKSIEVMQTVQIARFLVAAAIVSFPFAARSGFAPIHFLLSAAVVGLLWLATLLLGWRIRSQLLCAMSVPLITMTHSWVASAFRPEPWSYYIQWLTVAIIFGLAVPSIWRATVFRICHLDESQNS